MKNRFSLSLILGFLSIFFAGKVDAQLIANAGTPQIVCIGASGINNNYSLGGAPTVRGGTPPYRIQWSATNRYAGNFYLYATDYLEDTTALNPLFRLGFSTATSGSGINYLIV
jgi:hypothetical protein